MWLGKNATRSRTQPAFVARRQDVRQPVAAQAHVFTVDVEDYFQVEAFAGYVRRESWDQWPSRVVENTEHVLELLERHDVRATFFFLGWVASRFPTLVRQVHACGHELGCHSYWHRPVFTLTPKAFRADTRLAKHVIEDAAGAQVIGYRAPSWTITRQCVWALEVLAEEGFAYDCSVHPAHRDIFGQAAAGGFPYIHPCRDGLTLREYPPASLRVLGTHLLVASGGFLRMMPAAYTEIAFQVVDKLQGKRITVQVCPWEFDPGQPRIAAGWRSRWRHYANLGSMSDKVGRLLHGHRFVRFCDVLAEEGIDAGVQAPVGSTQSSRAVRQRG